MSMVMEMWWNILSQCKSLNSNSRGPKKFVLIMGCSNYNNANSRGFSTNVGLISGTLHTATFYLLYCAMYVVMEIKHWWLVNSSNHWIGYVALFKGVKSKNWSLPLPALSKKNIWTRSYRLPWFEKTTSNCESSELTVYLQIFRVTFFLGRGR